MVKKTSKLSSLNKNTTKEIKNNSRYELRSNFSKKSNELLFSNKINKNFSINKGSNLKKTISNLSHSKLSKKENEIDEKKSRISDDIFGNNVKNSIKVKSFNFFTSLLKYLLFYL